MLSQGDKNLINDIFVLIWPGRISGHLMDLSEVDPLFQLQSQEYYQTRLTYYDVKTRLADLLGLCWLEQNLVDNIC